MHKLTLAKLVVFPPQGPPVKTILYTGAGGATLFNSAVVNKSRSCGILDSPPEFERSRRVDSAVAPNAVGAVLDSRRIRRLFGSRGGVAMAWILRVEEEGYWVRRRSELNQAEQGKK